MVLDFVFVVLLGLFCAPSVFCSSCSLGSQCVLGAGNVSSCVPYVMGNASVFDFSGAVETLVVGDTVDGVHGVDGFFFYVFGGAGGSGKNVGGENVYGRFGGGGGYVEGFIAAVPGDVFEIEVGEGGFGPSRMHTERPWPDGGDRSYVEVNSRRNTASGGGSSRVRREGFLVAVAGGGGGGGAENLEGTFSSHNPTEQGSGGGAGENSVCTTSFCSAGGTETTGGAGVMADRFGADVIGINSGMYRFAAGGGGYRGGGFGEYAYHSASRSVWGGGGGGSNFLNASLCHLGDALNGWTASSGSSVPSSAASGSEYWVEGIGVPGALNSDGGHGRVVLVPVSLGSAGLDGLGTCVCGEGLFREGGACVECREDFWCPGGSEEAAFACPVHSGTVGVLGAVSIAECVCGSGFRVDNLTDMSSFCIECESGSYCPGGGLAIACPDPNMRSVVGSISVENCTCSAGYRRCNATKHECVVCEHGTFCPGGEAVVSCPDGLMTSPAGSTNDVNCSCPAGTYRSGAVCVVCPVDSYCPEGSLSPIACIADSGTVVPQLTGSFRESDCHCDAGHYDIAIPHEECVPCEVDRYCPERNVSIACPAGTGTMGVRGAPDVAECVAVPGRYLLDSTGSGAVECPVNFWCAGGIAEPIECPTNSSSVVGSDAVSDCVCNRGFYGRCEEFCPFGGCEVCPAGSFCGGGLSHTLCRDVRTGSTSVGGAGAVDVTSCFCAPGYYEADVGSGICELCPDGFWCPGGSMEGRDDVSMGEAIKCVNGSTSGGPGASAVGACSCLPGTYGDAGVIGAGACMACSAGFWCSGSGSMESCAVGASSDVGSVSVSDCACVPGFHGDAGVVGGVCSVCPPGSWCGGGDSVATTCVNGSTTAGNGSVGIEDCVCVAGMYGNAGVVGGMCSECPAGSWCSGGSSVVACPGNTTTLAGAGKSIADCQAVTAFPGTLVFTFVVPEGGLVRGSFTDLQFRNVVREEVADAVGVAEDAVSVFWADEGGGSGRRLLQNGDELVAEVDGATVENTTVLTDMTADIARGLVDADLVDGVAVAVAYSAPFYNLSLGEALGVDEYASHGDTPAPSPPPPPPPPATDGDGGVNWGVVGGAAGGGVVVIAGLVWYYVRVVRKDGGSGYSKMAEAESGAEKGEDGTAAEADAGESGSTSGAFLGPRRLRVPPGFLG